MARPTDPNQIHWRAEEAHRQFRSCSLCARQCRVDRASGARGACGLGCESYFFREMLIYGIELELIPAHAIYLTGCNMSCAWCNVGQWNGKPDQGQPWDASGMAERVRVRLGQGARTLLFLGGEPTVNMPAIFDLLSILPERPRVGWDSNMLLSAHSRELLQGIVDNYVADLKFGNDTCAKALAGVENYLEIMAENLPFAERTAGLIVRHLMVPGHLECCTLPVLGWLKTHLLNPRLSLQFGYRPPQGVVPDLRLRRDILPEDTQRARMAALELGLELVE